MEDLGAVVAELKDQITALKARVEQLEREVAAGPVHPATMKDSVRCPGCGGRWYFFATRILDRDGTLPDRPLSVAAPNGFNNEAYGQFEACICASCGLVEWYVDPRRVRVDGSVIRSVDARTAPPKNPYR